MFPHDEKIITIDQLTYYEKNTLTPPNGVLTIITSSLKLVTNYSEFGPNKFIPSTLLGKFTRDPPLIEYIHPPLHH